MKVRGMVLGNSGDVANLAEAGDNEIIIASNLEQIAAMGGLDKAITWWPVDKAAQVVRELYAQREQVKSSIYEITGISDIVRGASNAGETATAQQIKTQWGSLRIQKMQRLIQRQVRDIFVIMAEIIATKFSPQRIQQMTGEEMTTELRAMFDQPVLTSYRVDIESDSTIRADLTRAKGEMGEFLAGTASYFQTMAPLMQSAPQAAEPVVEIYAAFARIFSLGKQAEDALDQIVEMAKQAAQEAQQPPQPTPEQQLEERKLGLENRKIDVEEKKFQTEAATEMATQGLAQGPDGVPVSDITLLAQKLDVLAQYLMTPKQIVYDPEGRVVGQAPVTVN
jgi:hypothetical protein